MTTSTSLEPVDTGFHGVASLLQDEAIKPNQASLSDALARSAFNRFYYCSFHCVRRLVRDISTDAPDLNHADYPSFINGKMQEKLLRELNRAWRTRVITDAEYNRLRALLHSTTRRLAQIMEFGYRKRVTADYKPEVLVSVSNGTLILEGCSSKDASEWLATVSQGCQHIRNIWSTCGAKPIRN